MASSTLTKAQFVETARQNMRDAVDFWHHWRIEAKDCYSFISGKQWEEADEALLRHQKRPPITFNYSEKMIDAVVGAEVSGRNELVFKPRTIEDDEAAQLWTEAARWARQQCGAEFEESDAFRDMLVCGLGWTKTKVSYDEDQDGKIDKSRIDPLEVWPDPASCKVGLTDRRFHFHEYWTDEKDAKREWPGKTFISEPNDPANNSGVIIRGHRYEENSLTAIDNHKGMVLIRCYECMVQEPIYRAAIGGKVMEIPQADFSDLQDHFDEAKILYVRQYKRRYYLGYFSGDTLLEWGMSPCQDGFMYNVITGKRDRNKNTWYGLTRVMKDPQRWANKWLSQILHIINSNAKGGLMAEVNAFVDPRKAADEWSSPDSITWLKEGAISQGKVKERSVVNYPTGLDKLMQFALGSLPMVTGINLEALGLANRDQPGVLEQQRKQAAFGLLAPLFDGLRMYRINDGKVLYHLLNEYIADGRMIRIGGPGAEQYIQLAKRKDTLKFDLIVDEASTAPDVKERTWQALESLVPALIKAGMAVPPDVLDYAPIPTDLAMKWKQFIEQNSSVMSPEQAQQLQQQNQELQQENQQIKADKTAEMQKMQAEVQIMWQKLGLEKEKAQATIQIQGQKAELDTQIKAQQGQQQLQQDAQSHALAQQQQQEMHDQQMEVTEQQASDKSNAIRETTATKNKATNTLTKAKAEATAKPKPKG